MTATLTQPEPISRPASVGARRAPIPLHAPQVLGFKESSPRRSCQFRTRVWHSGVTQMCSNACYNWDLKPQLTRLSLFRMKCISVFILSAATLFAQGADLTTGQAARLVIGQRTFTSQDTNSSDIVVGAVGGI